MKKLNNKGYMLVEIILAFVLAISITYFMTELVIKLKNKNDDLLVKTIVSTDQTIIYNTIMKDVNKGTFSCDKITIEGNKVKYGDKTFVVSEYASIGNLVCDDTTDETRIHIPINVKQIPYDNFDVKIGIGDGIEGNTTLSCKLEMTSDNVIKLSDDFSFSGKIIYQGFDKNYEGENTKSKSIDTVGKYYYYIKGKIGLTEVTGSCGIDVVGKVEEKSCADSSYSWNGYNCSKTVFCDVNKKTLYTCSTTGTSYGDSNCGGKCTDGTCSETSKYTCSDSSCTLSGSSCSKKEFGRVNTSLNCEKKDYSEANDSYCWKVIE